MNRPLRDLIQWRIKAALIAHELRRQKKLRVARLINEATEAMEDYLQEEFGWEYPAELMALIQERRAFSANKSEAETIPFISGGRP